jgi:nucleotide-binding universal stress UspA family protein
MTQQPSRRLIFGDDGSVYADRAWLWINNQRWPGFEARIVTSVRRRDDVVSDETVPVKQESMSPRRAFAESELAGVSAFSSTSEPCAILSELGGDLTVVGPKGKRGLAALTLGSTSEYLMCRPSRPLVVAATSRPAKKVLVCVDGSDTASDAADFFATLPLAKDAEDVVVLGVILGGIDSPAVDVKNAVDETVERLAGLNARPLLVETETTVGNGIIEVVQRLGADLVVTGTRGTGAISRALVGSTTRTVSRSGLVTMLVVSP